MSFAKKSSRLFASLARGVALWVLMLAVGAGAWIVLDRTASEPQAATEVAASGWGSEALLAAHEELAALSPVAPANACGLGASSCFKCHNGKRAPAPSADAAAQPWHFNHQSVNYSCAGCHQGNPRILKQEIAHQKLIAKPLTAVDKTCASCHNAADVESLAARYHKVLNGGTQ